MALPSLLPNLAPSTLSSLANLRAATFKKKEEEEKPKSLFEAPKKVEPVKSSGFVGPIKPIPTPVKKAPVIQPVSIGTPKPSVPKAQIGNLPMPEKFDIKSLTSQVETAERERLRPAIEQKIAEIDKAMEEASSIFKGRAKVQKMGNVNLGPGEAQGIYMSLQKSKKTYENYLKGEEGGFFQGLAGGMKEVVPFTELVKTLAVNEAVKKKPEDRTLQEKQRLLEYESKSYLPSNLAYQFGQSIPMMLEVVGEYALTSGIAPALKSSVVKNLTSQLSKYGLKKSTAKLGGALGGAVIQSGIQSLAMPSGVATGIAKQFGPTSSIVENGDKISMILEQNKNSKVKNFLQGAAMGYSEVLIERLGGGLASIGLKLPKGKLANFLRLGTLSNMAKKSGIQGFAPELLEEEVTRMVQSWIQEKPYDVPFATEEGTRQILLESMGVALLQGMFRIPTIIQRAQGKKSRNEIIKEISNETGLSTKDAAVQLDFFMQSFKIGEQRTAGLRGPDKVPKKPKPLVPADKNWRVSYDETTDIFQKASILKAIANMKSTPKELGDILTKLEEIEVEPGIAYDVSENPAATKAIKKRALLLREKMMAPTGETIESPGEKIEPLVPPPPQPLVPEQAPEDFVEEVPMPEGFEDIPGLAPLAIETFSFDTAEEFANSFTTGGKNHVSSKDSILKNVKPEDFYREFGQSTVEKPITDVERIKQLTDFYNRYSKLRPAESKAPESIVGKTGLEATKIARENLQRQEDEYREFLRTSPAARKEIKKISETADTITDPKGRQKFLKEADGDLRRKYIPQMVKQKAAQKKKTAQDDAEIAETTKFVMDKIDEAETGTKPQPLVPAAEPTVVPKTPAQKRSANQLLNLVTAEKAPEFTKQEADERPTLDLVPLAPGQAALPTLEAPQRRKAPAVTKPKEVVVRDVKLDKEGKIVPLAKPTKVKKPVSTTLPIQDLIKGRLQAQGKGFIQGRKEARNELLAEFKDEKKSISEKQNALSRYIKENMGTYAPKSLIDTMRTLKTQKQLDSALVKVDKAIDKNLREIILEKLEKFRASESVYVDQQKEIEKALGTLEERSMTKTGGIVKDKSVMSVTELDDLLSAVEQLAEVGKQQRTKVDLGLQREADIALQNILNDKKVVNVDVEENVPEKTGERLTYWEEMRNKKLGTRRKLKEGWNWGQSTQRVIELGDKQNFKGSQFNEILIPIRSARYDADQEKTRIKKAPSDYVQEHKITEDESRAVQAYGYIQQKGGLEWVAFDNAKKTIPETFKELIKLDAEFEKLEVELKDKTITESRRAAIEDRISEINDKIKSLDVKIDEVMESEKEGILKFASQVPKDKRLIGYYNLVRGIFEDIYPRANAIMKTHYNKELPYVENYWAMYSAFSDDFVVSPEDKVAGMHKKININPTSIKHRKGQNARSPQQSAVVTTEMYINDMIHFIHVQPALLKAKKIISDPRYEDKAGKTMKNFLAWWFDTMAHQGRTPMTNLEKAANVVRGHAGIYMLGFKVTTTVTQYLALLQAAGNTAIGPRAFVNFGRIVYDPFLMEPEEEITAKLFKAVGIDLESKSEKIRGKLSDWKSKRTPWQVPLDVSQAKLLEFIWNASPEIRTRSAGELIISDFVKDPNFYGKNKAVLKDAPPGIREFLKLSPGERAKKIREFSAKSLRGAAEKTRDLAFWAMTRGDAQAASAAWLTAYENSLREQGKDFNIKKSDRQASVFSELATQRTQATVDYADLPRLLQNNKKEMSRLLVAHLQTFVINMWGIVSTDVPAALREDVFKGLWLILIMALQVLLQKKQNEKINEVLGHPTQDDPWWIDILDNTIGIMPVVNILYSTLKYKGGFAPAYGELVKVAEDFIALFTSEFGSPQQKRAAVGAVSGGLGLRYALPTKQGAQLFEDHFFPYAATVSEKAAFAEKNLNKKVGQELTDTMINLYEGGYLSENVRKVLELKKEAVGKEISDGVWDIVYMSDDKQKKSDAIIELFSQEKNIEDRLDLMQQMQEAGVFKMVSKTQSFNGSSPEASRKNVQNAFLALKSDEERDNFIKERQAFGILDSKGAFDGFEEIVFDKTLWKTLSEDPEFKVLMGD